MDGDDESSIQHPPPPQPPMLVKSPTDSALRAEVLVLGSPGLSVPFSGNEDINYIASALGPGLISRSPVHGGNSLSSITELSTRNDDTNQIYCNRHMIRV